MISRLAFLASAGLQRAAEAISRFGIFCRRIELGLVPIERRLIYAARHRCACGAGLAYDPARQHKREARAWVCSAVLASRPGSAKHSEPFPFSFHDIASERQPSARGATTRPPRP